MRFSLIVLLLSTVTSGAGGDFRSAVSGIIFASALLAWRSGNSHISGVRQTQELDKMALSSLFTHHLIPRSDDLAITTVPELAGCDFETMTRLANANIGNLGEERTFDYENMSFRVKLVTDSFFEEGQSITVVCDDPRLKEMR